MFCAECGARVQAPPAPPAPGPVPAVIPAVVPAAAPAAVPAADDPVRTSRDVPPSAPAATAAPAPAPTTAATAWGSEPVTAASAAAPPSGGGRRDARAAGTFPVVPGSVAPVGRRVAAYAIDLAALSLLAGLGVVNSLAVAGTPEAGVRPSAASFLPSLLGGLGGLALWICESVTGATVGGALLGIRTVSAETGRPAGLLRIFVRQLVVGLGYVACLVGEWLVVASGVFDKTPAQRGWHDKAAGTIVLLANATGVARSEDPAQAWDRAVARAVGPVPPPPPSSAPAPAPAPVPAPVAPAPVTPAPVTPAPVTAAPVTAAPVTAAPVTAAPVTTPPVTAPPVAAAPPAEPAADAAAAEPEPAAAIGLVPLPPGVGTGRPTERPPADGLITGPPARTQPTSAEPAPPAPTSGWSDTLAGEVRRTPGDTPPAGHDRVEPAAARGEDTSTAAQPIARAAADHPRWTEELDDIELTRLRTPVTGQPPVPPGLRLVFDTGERVDVLGEGVVGRAPQGDVEHVVAIDDPARSLSKTHLAFGPAEPGTLWVVDRGSTNGTLVVRPDGTAATLPAGTRASVGPGWSLRLGERTVRIEAR
nr:RDD family protein [Cellulomonas uda]